ncbi:transporter [Nevskia sp.]|uniref:transporter n=1 Tax=Nevskia sp. TaxID=1929292 RepID=UPI0025E6BA8D|nr:transporter [Nevskia sp.]
MKRLLVLGFTLLAAQAQAAILFTPHVSEYAKLPRGGYLDTTLVYSSIDRIRDADGRKVALGNTAIPPGEAISASLLLGRYLWIGNFFENSGFKFLADRDQVLRVIGTAGRQSASGAVNELSRDFGQSTRSSGLGDVFLLAGFYGREYHYGPLHGNGLYTLTVKAPVGSFQSDSLLNTGTRYWSVIPQLSHHQDWFGRFSVDATAAFQYNSAASRTAYGGLTPSKPASVFNLEANLAWKFSEHWFAEAGISHYQSLGSNRFDEVSLNLADQPVPPTAACETLLVPAAQCGLLDTFFLAPVPGQYRDRGIRNSVATAGFSYVYRSSAVFSARAALPVAGRGSQFTVPYHVCLQAPCNADTELPGARQNALLSGVQEAAAISASPYFELRLVFLLFAP